MGKVRKAQDAVDQRDPKGTKDELRAISDGGDQDEGGEGHEGVDEVQ